MESGEAQAVRIHTLHRSDVSRSDCTDALVQAPSLF